MTELKRTHKLPGGGSVTVTISSPDTINEADYLLLNPQAASEMAACLISLADSMKPLPAVQSGKEATK